ncbi:Uma2 family endonuclease [Streptomyces sp. NPDC021100]|uniref:Uma2 family endonuclease n=1 Tax=Streptomyces sp. NPDC021100 TaxID=3365114 RepID=UPI0037B57744
MAISELDRLHSKLTKLESQLEGYKGEIVGGAIMMSPVKPIHGKTMRRLGPMLESQLAGEWEVVEDVAFVFSEDDEFCPDLAVIPAAEETRNLGSYPADLIELAVEVVSPSSVRNDYRVKDRAYARAGIANYLVFDPYKGHCVTLWNPGPDGYLGRDTVPYGKTVTVESSIGPLSFDTSGLPVALGG